MTAPDVAARVAAIEADAQRPYVRLTDKTVWPNPADPNEVQWRLRYGAPTKEDLLVAASMMSAYRELVMQTNRRRTEVCRALAVLTTSADGGAE